ncbi:MAG: hypothetical protein Q9227_002816 [Pyrenula ochraceoflavens]
MKSISVAALATLIPYTLAQQPMYAQCGGKNWTGGTTCVEGATCVPQEGNEWYSQCLPGSSNNSGSQSECSSTTEPTSVSHPQQPSQPQQPTTTPVATPTQPTSNPQPSSSSATASAPSSGQTYKASMTFYGSTDTWGSGNCQVSTTACGFYTSGTMSGNTGFVAAVSQNEFGVGPGAGAGPACGTCWKLTGQTDSNGAALANAGNSIVVMVNNLCPADGNPLCSQSGMTGTNQYGANMNFDLCVDSGAKNAFFGSDNTGLGVGTAEEVDCSEWTGSIVH